MPLSYNSLRGGCKMNCTVVILTYNRPHHLKRILSYYHQYGSSLPIIIADSSSEGNKKLNRETILSFNDISFIYLDKYDPNTNPYQKIFVALQQVSTKYCVLCPDDDFVTPSGIQQSSYFLDINPDFTTACGKEEFLFLYPDRGGELQIQFLKCHSHPYSCSEPRERLVYEMPIYDDGSFYAVRNTVFTKMLFTEALKFINLDAVAGSSEYAFGIVFAEWTIRCLSAIYGKKKCLDTLFYVRECCTPANLKNPREHPANLQNFIREGNYGEKKHKFADCLAGHLSEQSGIDLVESYKLVYKCVSENMEKGNSFMGKIDKMITDIKLPNWLDHGIRIIYRAAASLFFSPAERAYSLTPKYYEDSNQIRLCVLLNANDIYAIDP